MWLFGDWNDTMNSQCLCWVLGVWKNVWMTNCLTFCMLMMKLVRNWIVIIDYSEIECNVVVKRFKWHNELIMSMLNSRTLHSIMRSLSMSNCNIRRVRLSSRRYRSLHLDLLVFSEAPTNLSLLPNFCRHKACLLWTEVIVSII